MTDLDRTVLGMDLDDAGSMDDLAQPLDAVIIVKGLSTSGDVSYWNAATLDLTTVECLGMVGYADIVLRDALNTDDE